MSNINWIALFFLALTACSSEGVKDIEKSAELTQALASGDAQFIVESQEIITAIDDLTEKLEFNQISLLQQVYGSGQIEYPASRNSQFIQVKELGLAYPVVVGNGGLMLAAASQIDEQRNGAFGTNIIRELQNGSFPAFETPFKNLLAWLLKRSASNLSTPTNIAMLTVSDSTASSNISWLNQHFDSWQVNNCKIADEVAACISDADLVIVSTSKNIEQSQLETSLATLKASKTPLLYVHQDSWNTNDFTPIVMSAMGFYMQSSGGPGNYFSQDQAIWSNYQAMLDGVGAVASVYQLVRRLENDDFSFDISACVDNCNDIELFNSEFNAPLNLIKNIINQLDKTKVDIFSSERYELEKLVVLLADKYRQQITYPMDTDTTSTSDFLRAMFADAIIFSHRKINAMQKDLGNFSRTDFSHIAVTSKIIDLLSKRSFKSAGVYALPGQSFSVTRLDNSELTTKVFINTQRSGSTHEFETNGYSRPKNLQSQHIEVKSGETITLTNPYGGPIQIEFSTNDLPVSFEFKNIGLHPYWNGPEDDEAFTQALNAGDFDWAELITPGFEVHSQLSKMRDSMTNDAFPSAEELSEATMRYMHNFPHVLAGFQGPGIDVVPEIHDFASEKGYTIDTIDIVKHMNADQATCGYGCSGNPYDAYWEFNPTGHGDIHELGHGLERGRFRFSGWDGHASTNPYSYYSKSQFFKDTGNQPSCQSLPFDDLLETLQASQLSADPFAHMQAASLTGWSQGVAIYIQMMMAAQHQDELEDGWHLLARLHIYEREFNRAIQNDETWLEKRVSLGLGLYDLTSAKALNNNDWLTNGISWVTGLDYREFLTMWGLSFSADISAQVQQHSLEKATAQFFQASGDDYCNGLDKAPLAIIAP